MEVSSTTDYLQRMKCSIISANKPQFHEDTAPRSPGSGMTLTSGAMSSETQWPAAEDLMDAVDQLQDHRRRQQAGRTWADRLASQLGKIIESAIGATLELPGRVFQALYFLLSLLLLPIRLQLETLTGPTAEMINAENLGLSLEMKSIEQLGQKRGVRDNLHKKRIYERVSTNDHETERGRIEWTKVSPFRTQSGKGWRTPSSDWRGTNANSAMKSNASDVALNTSPKYSKDQHRSRTGRKVRYQRRSKSWSPYPNAKKEAITGCGTSTRTRSKYGGKRKDRRIRSLSAADRETARLNTNLSKQIKAYKTLNEQMKIHKDLLREKEASTKLTQQETLLVEAWRELENQEEPERNCSPESPSKKPRDCSPSSPPPPTASRRPPTRPRHPRRPTTIYSAMLALVSFNAIAVVFGYDLSRREYDPRKVTNINMTAYDCSVNGNFSAVDLVDLNDCHNPETDYLPVENITVSLIQTNVPIHINVLRCKITLTKKVLVHGMSSYVYHYEDNVDEKMIWITPQMCADIHSKEGRTFMCTSNLCGGKPSSLFKIPFNDKEEMFSWQTRGAYDDKKNAIPTTFELENGKVIYGVETAYVKITLSNYTATLNAKTEVVEVPNLHARVDFHQGYHYHETAGLLAWAKPDINCSMFSTIIAKDSPATIRKLKPDKRPAGQGNDLVGAIVIVEDEEANRATGVVLAETRDSCTRGCHETNVDSLNVCIGGELDTLDPLETRPATRLTRLNLQSQGTYLQLNSKLERDELHAEMLTEICRIEKKLIHQDIASILNTANPYALVGMSTNNPDKPLGNVHDVVIMGSVAYFSKCRPEPVRVVEISNCTQQIPVIRADGSLWFVDSISSKLVEFPNVITCITGLPVQYKINGNFYCHDPVHRACPQGTEPNRLQPAAGEKGRGIQLDDLKHLGDLTTTVEQEFQIREHKKLSEMNYVVINQITRNAALNTRTESNRLGGLINIAMPLTDVDINRLTDAVAGRMFFMFKILGQVYLHILGITMFLTVIKHLFECAYRMYYLYQHYGWGMWMWKALFNTVFSVVALPKLLLVKSAKEMQKSFAQERDKILPSPDFQKYDELLKRHADNMSHLRQVVLDLASQAHNVNNDEVLAKLYPVERVREETELLVNYRPDIPFFNPGEAYPGPDAPSGYQDNPRFHPNFNSFRNNQENQPSNAERGQGGYADTSNQLPDEKQDSAPPDYDDGKRRRSQ